MDKRTVGIIGAGVVGKAIGTVFKESCNVVYNDPNVQSTMINKDMLYSSPLEVVVRDADLIFVCVPTPMTNKGEFSPTIVNSVMESLNVICTSRKRYPIIVVKSAVIPTVVKEWLSKYKALRIIVSPEYLGERDPLMDLIHQELMILGGDLKQVKFVMEFFYLYSICNRNAKVGFCSQIDAALIKYMENSFLAMKVSFMNQFYSLHDVLTDETNTYGFDHVAGIFHFDSRMGNSHNMVPGPDNKFGFGGKCLIKDVNSITNMAIDLGCPLTILEECLTYNEYIRDTTDDLFIKGVLDED